jgi:hypothetical protein
MGGDLYAGLVVTVAGFVVAGVIASFYQLVTAKPCGFEIEDRETFPVLMAVVTCMFAGPVILMRNALRGRRIERRHVGWLVATTLIAGGWSLCSGTVVLSFFFALKSSMI